VKVLVTGAGALLGQGVIRCLLESRLRPEIVAVDPSPLSAGLYWVERRHLVPMANDPAYLDAFAAILDRERPDAVLVGTDVELAVLSEHRAALEARYDTHVVVASPEVVAIADDKWKTFQFLRDHGFPAPASCLPGGEEALVADVGFPLVVKPRVGARAVGMSVVRGWDELRSAVASLDAPVIQECVATERDEYTAGTLTFDGRCDAAIVMRRDLRDGNTYRAWVEPWPHLDAEVRRLAEALGAEGPSNFQFRLDRAAANAAARDAVKVFEINARFSGTTPLRRHAGFDEVELALRHVVLGEPVVQPEVTPVTILRHWSETVVRPDEVVRR
jgi:carbamoyl-phosphate synthase large subunit